MALQAESNRVGIRLSQETVWNEVPTTPVMADLPYTSESLAYDKRTVKSNTVRADRLTDDVIEVGGGSGGDINFEYKYSDFDKLIEGALGSSFTAGTFTGAANISFAAAAGGVQIITGPAATWTPFVVGSYVTITAANAQNNGTFLITAKTSTTLTVKNPLGTVQAATSAAFNGKSARTGITKTSYLVEKSFGDITQFQTFRGLRVGAWSMNVETEAIVTGSFTLMGAGVFSSVTTVSASVTTQSANSVANATSNIGRIEEAGVALTTALRSVKFTLNANPRALPAVGQKFPIGINFGSFEITGTISAYFEDQILFAKFLNHNDSSLVLEIVSPEGKRTIITITALKFTKAAPVGAGLNQDVMVDLDFIAKKDSVYNSMMQVDLVG